MLQLTTGAQQYLEYRSLTMLRGLLIAVVFRKTTEVSVNAVNDRSALTLMSTDVERVIRGLRDVHNLWAIFIEIGVATYLFERQLGLACIGTLLVIAIVFGLTTATSKLVQKYQMVWLGKIQRRIEITSSMLGVMKSVKMSGLSEGLGSIIQMLRVEEIQSARAFRLITAAVVALGASPLCSRNDTRTN